MDPSKFSFMKNIYQRLADVHIINETDIERMNSLDGGYAFDSAFFYLYSHERIIFFAVYLIIYVVAFFGNIFVLIITVKRKQRYIQKSCLISLSLSDFITATSNTLMHLSTFVEELKIWTLGSFMCSFLPLLSIFGIVCSSAALVGIAYDRYQNVVHALKTRWQPTLNQCVIGFSILWICSAGISYPMYTFFDYVSINIIFYDKITLIPNIEKKYLCISFVKNELMIYYITLMCILFLPMIFIYVWLYIKIAQLVWKHRKPVGQKYNETLAGPTSTSQAKTSDTKNTTQPNIKHSVFRKEATRVERKLRTFKILVFLMCIFLILRLPSLMFDPIKVSGVHTSHLSWILKYVFIALTLLSCALNPFLYTFLNSTIQTLQRLKEFLYEVCCFCLSTKEFEELQNGNPFMQKPFEKNTDESDTSTKKPKTKTSVTFGENPNIQPYSYEYSQHTGKY